MTANQMADLFELNYDVAAGLSAPGYNDSQISDWLNQASLTFVKQNYRPAGNKYREGFEATEKRRKDFSELVRGPVNSAGTLLTSISVNQNGVLQYGRFFDLPTDFWLAISEECLTDADDCTSTTTPRAKLRIPIKPITHDEYTANKRNPQRKPYVDANEGLAWRVDYSKLNSTAPKRHEIVTDGTFNITEYYLRYIKKLDPIVVDRVTPGNQVNSELDSEVHEEVVALAVKMAAAATRPDVYQVKINEELNKE